ncbi:MAG: DNA oxidative demethylase AlkB [Chitinophagaceae bacterium]|nr:DNA oxidative demethylase AlkB [Oligoflexus sp.]
MLNFEDFFGAEVTPEIIRPGAVLLREFARKDAPRLTEDVRSITRIVPFRAMQTQGGAKMSLMASGCGDLTWLRDEPSSEAAVYSSAIPEGEDNWPDMPPLFLDLARRAANAGGFPGFEPNACLINRYRPGAKLGLHQDRDERDDDAPIVSVSLGLPIIFLFGGLERSGPIARIPLDHGDVVVWGGPARLAYHGVLPLKEGFHPAVGRERINLTFRKIRT